MHAQLEEQPAKSSVGECLKGFEGAALTALNIVENMGKALGKPDVEFAFARGFGSFASGMVLAAKGEPCDAPAVTTRGEHEHGEESGDDEGGSTDTTSWLEEAKHKAHEQSQVEPRESLSGAPSKAEPEPLQDDEAARRRLLALLGFGCAEEPAASGMRSCRSAAKVLSLLSARHAAVFRRKLLKPLDLTHFIAPSGEIAPEVLEELRSEIFATDPECFDFVVAVRPLPPTPPSRPATRCIHI